MINEADSGRKFVRDTGSRTKKDLFIVKNARLPLILVILYVKKSIRNRVGRIWK